MSSCGWCQVGSMHRILQEPLRPPRLLRYTNARNRERSEAQHSLDCPVMMLLRYVFARQMSGSSWFQRNHVDASPAQ